MVIDSIIPTFSIPSASTFFEISTDNGITYTDANAIEVNYYALNKMINFIGDTNPLNLLFRKKSNITDESDYRVTKILVNTASTFLPSPNTGLNVESASTQEAQNPYLAGRYATYNSVTTGGLNFSDFKIQSINNTDMQMVFFVTPVGGMWVIIETPRLEIINEINGKSTLKLNVAITEGNGVVYDSTLGKYKVWIDGNTTQIKVKTNLVNGNLQTTNCYFYDGNSKVEVGSNVGRLYKIWYALTYCNCFDTQIGVGLNAFTGNYEWTISIANMVWVDDPKIKFEITGVRCCYRVPDEGITENYIWYTVDESKYPISGFN